MGGLEDLLIKNQPCIVRKTNMKLATAQVVSQDHRVVYVHLDDHPVNRRPIWGIAYMRGEVYHIPQTNEEWDAYYKLENHPPTMENWRKLRSFREGVPTGNYDPPPEE